MSLCGDRNAFLAMELDCEGEARNLARNVLTAACSGGRESIVQELLLKWNGRTRQHLYKLYVRVLIQ